MKKTKTLLIRLTDEEHNLLRRESFERNISMSMLIKQALLVYLKRFNVAD